MTRNALVSLVCLLALIAAPALADVPALLNYQGYLTDDVGLPITDPAVEMEFTVWDDQTDDDPAHLLWTETWDSGTGTVAVIDGYCSVLLGSYQSFGTLFEDHDDLWLEIEVDGSLLSPRKQIASSAYNQRSKVAGSVPWTGITGLPAGFADDIDDVGLMTETDPTVLASVKDGVDFLELTGTATDGQIPDDITIDYATAAGSADTLGALDSTQFMRSDTDTGTTGSLSTGGKVSINVPYSPLEGGLEVGIAGSSSATGMGSVALIRGTASGGNSFAAGFNAKALGNSTTAIGGNVTASESAGVAIGTWSTASGNSSMALGIEVTASGTQSSALGSNVSVSGQYSTIIGAGYSYPTLSQNNTIALIGDNVGIGTVTPSGQLQVAGTTTLENLTVTGTTTGVSADSAPWAGITGMPGIFSDGVMDFSELTGMASDPQIPNDITIDWCTAAGTANTLDGLDSTQFMRADAATGTTGSLSANGKLKVSVASSGAAEIGHFSNSATGLNSVAIGGQTAASNDYSFATGADTLASGLISTAMGNETVASHTISTAMGNNTTASGFASTAMGNFITVNGSQSFGIGLDEPESPRTITQANTMAILGGKVGIGTETPSVELEVAGDVTISGTLSAGAIASSDCSTGTLISSLSYTISTAGLYCLADNLTSTGVTAITIAANNVALDLLGHALFGTGSAGEIGIDVGNSSSVEIRNGTVVGFGSHGISAGSSSAGVKVFNVGAHSNGAAGTGSGISLDGANHFVAGCQARGNSFRGVFVGYESRILNTQASQNATGLFGGRSAAVERCTANDNTYDGIFVGAMSQVVNSVSYANGADGIEASFGSIVRGCNVSSNQNWGIYTGYDSSIVDNVAKYNNVSGGAYGDIKTCSNCSYGTECMNIEDLCTPIDSIPFTISSPGSYCLTRNLTLGSNVNAITVTANNVTIDLRGYVLDGDDRNVVGISIVSSTNVEIRNGTITGMDGIESNAGGNSVIGVRMIDVVNGIHLEGKDNIVDQCRVVSYEYSANGTGIYVNSGTIRDSTVRVTDDDYIGIDAYSALIKNCSVAGAFIDIRCISIDCLEVENVSLN